MSVTRNVICGAKCSDISTHPREKCKDCDGRGIKLVIKQLGPGMVQSMQQKCSPCHGRGTYFYDIYIYIEKYPNLIVNEK